MFVQTFAWTVSFIQMIENIRMFVQTFARTLSFIRTLMNGPPVLICKSVFCHGFAVNFSLLFAYRMDRLLMLHYQWRSASRPVHFLRPTILSSSALHLPSLISYRQSPHHWQNTSSILALERGLLVSSRTVQMDQSGMQITAYLDNAPCPGKKVASTFL